MENRVDKKKWWTRSHSGPEHSHPLAGHEHLLSNPFQTQKFSGFLYRCTDLGECEFLQKGVTWFHSALSSTYTHILLFKGMHLYHVSECVFSLKYHLRNQLYIYNIFILVQCCVLPWKPTINLVNTFGNKIALGSPKTCISLPKIDRVK